MESAIEIGFSVKRFCSSKDKDFLQALMLYNNTTPAETKTNSTEILYFVDHSAEYSKREMYFFGLYLDGMIVGFVEAGYLKTTKVILVDYIVLKEQYRLNSVFYPLFSLIQRYFSEHMIDYDYIATEVSTKCPEQLVDSESFFSKKMLCMEDFRIVEALYRQPRLGLDNFESNFSFQLLLRSAQPVISIRKETYLAIVQDIYFEHYYPWYARSDQDRKQEYYDHLNSEYARIKESIADLDVVQLSGQTPSCAYYKAPDCHFNSSTAGFVPKTSGKHKSALLLAIPFIMACAFGFALLIYYVLNELNIQPDKFSGLFAAVTAVCTGLFTLAFSKISKTT